MGLAAAWAPLDGRGRGRGRTEERGEEEGGDGGMKRREKPLPCPRWNWEGAACFPVLAFLSGWWSCHAYPRPRIRRSSRAGRFLPFPTLPAGALPQRIQVFKIIIVLYINDSRD